MSQIDLETVKKALRVTHDEDDEFLQRLIDSSETECKRFLELDELPLIEDISSEPPVQYDVVNGIILMVQADYDGDPLMRDKLRAAAEALWMPYATQGRLSV